MPNTTMSRGMPCDMYKGYCDALGTCQAIDMDGPMRLLYFTFFTEEGKYDDRLQLLLIYVYY